MADEIHRLRTALRDLVALSTIPAVWVGREPTMIAAGLADVLVGSLHLDFAFVRLHEPNGGAAISVTRGNAWNGFPEWLQSHLAALDQHPRKEIIRDADGRAEPSRGLVIPIGINADGGFVAVACDRTDFPTETDQLLLSVAANQAATAFQGARLMRALAESLENLHAAQDRLVQTEKFAALGRLVAGVAHEINTPVGNSLTVASTFINKTDRFEADVAGDNVRRSILNEYLAASREALSQIMANLIHAADLIQSFKEVAAESDFSDRRGFDLGQMTEQIVRSLRSGLRSHNLTFRVDCEPNLAMNSYPGLYGQVLTNLVVNSAAHAFPNDARGSVQITARVFDQDNVEISISDDGCGMTPEIQRQAFDPFFTTRRDQGRVGL